MNTRIGTGLVILSAVCFGSMAIFAKFAAESGITTHALLFYRFFLAGVLLAFLVRFRNLPLPRGRDLLTLMAMGFFCYAGQSFCFFTALTLIPPSLVAILLYLYPVFVAVLSVFFLDETMTPHKVSALTIAVAGTVLVVGPEFSGNIRGILFGIGTACFYSVYNIAGARVMGRNDTLGAAQVVVLSAAAFYLLYNIKAGFFLPRTAMEWLPILAIALVSTVTAIWTYFQGIKLIGAVNASMLSTFEPVTTMVLSFLVLGQKISGLQLTGAALILGSAAMIAARPQAKPGAFAPPRGRAGRNG